MVASIDTISRLRQQDARTMVLRRALRSPTVVFTQLLLNYNCPVVKCGSVDIDEMVRVSRTSRPNVGLGEEEPA